jgi:hypothetical protein
MFLCGRLWPFDQFFVPAALALPHWIHGGWISGVLVDRSFRRNYFSAAAWASASAGGALFDVDIEQLALIVHFISPVLPRRRLSLNRICDDDKPEQRSCKRLKPAAPATRASQCSGSGRRRCLIRSRPGTLHTGPAPIRNTTRTTTIQPALLRSNALSTGAFLATRPKT